jgi:hypothetical protein
MARRKEPRILDHLLDQLLAGADAQSACHGHPVSPFSGFPALYGAVACHRTMASVPIEQSASL